MNSIQECTQAMSSISLIRYYLPSPSSSSSPSSSTSSSTLLASCDTALPTNPEHPLNQETHSVQRDRSPIASHTEAKSVPSINQGLDSKDPNRNEQPAQAYGGSHRFVFLILLHLSFYSSLSPSSRASYAQNVSDLYSPCPNQDPVQSLDSKREVCDAHTGRMLVSSLFYS